MFYSPIESRIRDLMKHPYGSPEHRKLVLALAECFDLVLPFWKHPSPTLASCSRHAKRFGDDAGFNYGILRQLRTRVFGVQRGLDYDKDTASYRISGAAFDVLHVVSTPMQAFDTYHSIGSAYIESRRPEVADQGDVVKTMVAAMREDRILSDEFDAKATVILDRYFPQESP